MGIFPQPLITWHGLPRIQRRPFGPPEVPTAFRGLSGWAARRPWRMAPPGQQKSHEKKGKKHCEEWTWRWKKHSEHVFFFVFLGIEASRDWGLIIKSFRFSHQTLHGLVMFTAKDWISLGPAPSPPSHAQSSKLEFHMQRVGHCHPRYLEPQLVPPKNVFPIISQHFTQAQGSWCPQILCFLVYEATWPYLQPLITHWALLILL